MSARQRLGIGLVALLSLGSVLAPESAFGSSADGLVGTADTASSIVRVSRDRFPADAGAQPETQAEPQAAVSPLNPNVVFAVWQDGRLASFGAAAIGWGVSRDGGKTWKRGRLPRLTTATGGPYTAATDPWVAFDAAGRAHVVALVRNDSGASATSAIVAYSTTNLGAAWQGPVVVHASETFVDDKVSVAVDRVVGSPQRGTVYVGWSIAGRVVVARSRDEGRTFGAPIPLGPAGVGVAGIGIVLAVSNGGRVHAVWQRSPELSTSSSTDGGLTWSEVKTVAEVVSPGVLGVRTGDGLPSLAAAGRKLYVVWHDGRFAPDETVHVAIAVSNDAGVTWQAPRRISGGPLNAASFLPAVAVDDRGRVGVSFLSVRNDPAKAFLADQYFVSSIDSGRTFRAPTRLTSRSVDLRDAAVASGQVFVGDYFGLAAGTQFHSVFVVPWIRSVIEQTRSQPDVLAVSVTVR